MTAEFISKLKFMTIDTQLEILVKQIVLKLNTSLSHFMVISQTCHIIEDLANIG